MEKRYKTEKYSEEFLISELKRYNREFGKPPTARELDKKETGFPNRKTYQKYFGSFGNALVQAGFEYKGIKEKHIGKKRNPPHKREVVFTKEKIKKYIDKYIEENERIPTLTELEKIPNYPIRNDFRRLFGTYNNALKEFNLHPKFRRYSDKELKDFIVDYINKYNEIPTKVDFETRDEYPSTEPYTNRFGSWNKAIEYFGFKPRYGYIDIERLKEEINYLCHKIYENENRKIITYSDINESKTCATVSTYDRNFREFMGISLREYINSIGFDFPQPGMGIINRYEDGEVTLSKWEFKVSEYLRDNGLKYNEGYFRNVKYSEFISNYDGNMDCDYLIFHNNSPYYIEIAGMLDVDKMGRDSKIELDYLKRLHQKEKLLNESEVNYKIIYPHDLRLEKMNNLFSFLHT